MSANKRSTVSDWFTTAGLFVWSGVELFMSYGHTRTGQSGVGSAMLAGLFLVAGCFMYAALRKKMIPFSRWLGRICVVSVAVLAVTTLAHLTWFHPFSWACESLDVLRLYESRWWPDHLLLAALWTMSIAGVLLALIRKETRKKALLLLLAFLVAIGVLSGALRNVSWPRWVVTIVGDTVAMGWLVYCGVTGAWFEIKYGPSVQKEYDAKMAAKAARLSGNQTMTGHVAGTVPAPKPAGANTNTNTPKPAPVSRPAPAPARPVSAPRTAPQREAASAAEARVKQSLEAYLKKKNLSQPRRETARARQFLGETAHRLYPGSGTLARLDGQRQLFMWVTALPCLESFRTSQYAQDLMDPGLPDDPERFALVVKEIVSNVQARLRVSVLDDTEEWAALDAETLAGAWFALRAYMLKADDTEIFELASEQVEEYMSGRGDMMLWLEKNAGKED